MPTLTRSVSATSSATAADEPAARRRAFIHEFAERAAFLSLLVAVIWAPWPLGSNRPWALAILGAVVWFGVIAALMSHLWPPRSDVPFDRSAASAARAKKASHTGRGFLWALPLAALAGFALLLVAQTMPSPLGQFELASIDPFQTRRYLFATLTYAGAWLLVLMTVNSSERAATVLGAVAAAGVLQATAAVMLYSSGGSYQLWFADFDQGGRAMGTFVNPDHLAGFMELSLAAGLGWLIAQLGEGRSVKQSGWRHNLVSVLAFVMSPKMLLRLLLILPVMALVMTHSRMGNGAFFLALLLIGVLVAVRSQKLRRPALWLVASMAVVDVFIIGQWVGVDRVMERIKDTAAVSKQVPVPFGTAQLGPPREQSLAERLDVPLLSLKLVAQRPWFGHGGGTYVTALPPLKREDLVEHWDHAHNDYVQVASDTGLVGLLLWLTAGVASAWRALQLVRDQQAPVNRGLGVAALMACACMGLHSMVDFNLHIPANALTFTVLLAAVWALPRTSRRA